MRLTRRGYGAVAVTIIAIAFAAHSGPRSLNAVTGPALVALAYGWFTLRRRDEPSISRRKPAPGFPGETREVALRLSTAGPATVSDQVGDGLARIADTPDGYTVELRDRGAQTLGPATVRETDAFGLLAAETIVSRTTELLVYPTVEPLTPNRTFRGLVDRAGSPDRDAFESLREYTPSDPLRNVHWKSSAKRQPGELVVTEYATPDEGWVTVVAEGAGGRGDAMASAAASIAIYLLDAGVAVEVVAPDGFTDQRRGPDARDEILELLARTEAGRVGAEGDVRVTAESTQITVAIDGRSFPFEDLQGGEPTDVSQPGVTAP